MRYSSILAPRASGETLRHLHRTAATILVLGMTAGACAGCTCREHTEAPPPRVDHQSSPKPEARPAGPPLSIEAFSFAGPSGHRPDRTFARGETAVCLFTVSNFTYRDRNAHIRAEIRVTGPGDELLLHQPDLALIDGPAPSLRPGTIRTAASLPIHPAAPPGEHTVHLTLRDELSGGVGSSTTSYTLEGAPEAPADNLTVTSIRQASDGPLPPGSIVPVFLAVKGMTTSPEPGGTLHRVDLGIEARVENEAGEALATRHEPLVQTTLPFAPASYPVEYMAALPRDLSPGRHRLALTIADQRGGGKASALLQIEVAAPELGVYNLHAHDAGKLPRRSFLLGEQIFVRLALHGLATRDGELSAAVDVAIAGPDGGVYLARKGAAEVSGERSRTFAAVGRYPVQLPLVLPSLCPTGTYRVIVVARDRLAGKTTTGELKIRIQGNAPQPLATFKVTGIEVRDRPDLPPLAGDTFGAGRSYNLVLRLGGVKMEQVAKMTFKARIRADLRLRRVGGELAHEAKGLFTYDRTTTYRPLRILIASTWEVPADLPAGLYDLEVSALNELQDQVSQLVRRVEIVRAAPR